MQLFITSHLQKKGNQIILKDVPELLSQIRKVLRGKIWDTIAVQNREWTIVRYTLEIIDWTDKDLVGDIVKEEVLVLPSKKVVLLIALPNKWDKAELIVQKLTEIGVNEIIFRPAERSVITQWNEKKAERLLKIAQEATEQSRGIQIPSLSFSKDIISLVKEKKVYVFDKWGMNIIKENEENTIFSEKELYGVVWPEGGLTKKDYQILEKYEVLELGENILRMETAAIVGGWILRNS